MHNVNKSGSTALAAACPARTLPYPPAAFRPLANPESLPITAPPSSPYAQDKAAREQLQLANDDIDALQQELFYAKSLNQAGYGFGLVHPRERRPRGAGAGSHPQSSYPLRYLTPLVPHLLST